MNLGKKGVWNGSVTLSGTYDRQRVNSSSWITVPQWANLNGSTTFLQNGTMEFWVFLTQRVHTADDVTGRRAVLDINTDAIIVPSSYECKQPAVEIFAPLNTIKRDYEIAIPDNLTGSKDRCYPRKTAPNNSRADDVILSRTFFQAAYVYVDTNGQVYMAQAHRYDIPSPSRSRTIQRLSGHQSNLLLLRQHHRPTTPQVFALRARHLLYLV